MQEKDPDEEEYEDDNEDDETDNTDDTADGRESQNGKTYEAKSMNRSTVDISCVKSEGGTTVQAKTVLTQNPLFHKFYHEVLVRIRFQHALSFIRDDLHTKQGNCDKSDSRSEDRLKKFL